MMPSADTRPNVFSRQVPATTSEADTAAEKALKIEKDSTTDEEISLLVSKILQLSYEMGKVLLTDEEERLELIKQLSNELAKRRDKVIGRASQLLKREISVSSLHGKIGGKNNDYADCLNNKFVNFQDFYTAWLNEFNNRCERDRVKIGQNSSLSELLTLFSDDDIREYSEIFLERNFFKNYLARVRSKPTESLWKVWFGNQIVYGLLIAPVKCMDGSIRTDRSEIRRASYNYWTIGHVMHTGLYDPENNDFYHFYTVDDFLKYYLGVVKRLSKSQYEKEICNQYVGYLSQSEDVLSEPLLIPEFRYEGLNKKCKYRVDFTVLNPYTFHFVGFELSPASSHMSISKMKEKEQGTVNAELKVAWEKEMHKRNDYLKHYGVSLITFTDSDLLKIDDCFEQIKIYLNARGDDGKSIKYEESRLQSIIKTAKMY